VMDRAELGGHRPRCCGAFPGGRWLVDEIYESCWPPAQIHHKLPRRWTRPQHRVFVVWLCQEGWAMNRWRAGLSKSHGCCWSVAAAVPCRARAPATSHLCPVRAPGRPGGSRTCATEHGLTSSASDGPALLADGRRGLARGLTCSAPREPFLRLPDISSYGSTRYLLQSVGASNAEGLAVGAWCAFRRRTHCIGSLRRLPDHDLDGLGSNDFTDQSEPIDHTLPPCALLPHFPRCANPKTFARWC